MPVCFSFQLEVHHDVLCVQFMWLFIYTHIVEFVYIRICLFKFWTFINMSKMSIEKHAIFLSRYRYDNNDSSYTHIMYDLIKIFGILFLIFI